jgi:hypothetical protein
LAGYVSLLRSWFTFRCFAAIDVSLLRSWNIYKTAQASEKRNIKISKSIFCFAEAGNCVIQRSWNIYKTAQASEKRIIKYQNKYLASPKL